MPAANPLSEMQALADTLSAVNEDYYDRNPEADDPRSLDLHETDAPIDREALRDAGACIAAGEASTFERACMIVGYVNAGRDEGTKKARVIASRAHGQAWFFRIEGL